MTGPQRSPRALVSLWLLGLCGTIGAQSAPPTAPATDLAPSPTENTGELALFEPGDTERADAARAAPTQAYIVDIEVLRVPRAAVERATAGMPSCRALRERLDRDPSQCHTFAVAMTAAERQRVFAAWRDAPGSQALFRGSVGATSLRTSRAHDGAEIPYVRDYDFDPADELFAFEPVLGTARDGVFIAVAVCEDTTDPATRRCALSIEHIVQKKPIPTFTPSGVGGPSQLTVQRPQATTRRGAGRLEIARAEGSCVLFFAGEDASIYAAHATPRPLIGSKLLFKKK